MLLSCEEERVDLRMLVKRISEQSADPCGTIVAISIGAGNEKKDCELELPRQKLSCMSPGC